MEEFDESKKKSKKQKITIALLAILAVVIVVGTSFALWQLTLTQSGTNVITTGCLNLTLTDDTDAINLVDATPTTDEEGRKLSPYTFTLTNTCTTQTAYVINLETVSSGDKILADEYVKANLLKGTEEIFIDKLVESHQNLDKVITDASRAYMLTSGKLAGNESLQFSLRLWMDESTPALDEVMEATFQGKITITASYVPLKPENENELYNIIKKQASLDNEASEFVTSSTGINFGEAPSDTNGKGAYTIASTKDSEYPVHYFRGEVTNNNVKFANLCWKIVRTTETGGVKLIYNGAPDEAGGCTNTGEATQIGTSKFNENNDSADYVGYMYPETNENPSTIKTAIDTWYQTNMIDYTKYLEDTVWCNDRSVYKTEGVNIHYGAYGRNVETYSPSIECPNENDKFTVSSEVGNGKLTYPVALLTADEATLAGNGYNGFSNKSYLYTGQWYWLLTPNYFYSSYAYGFSVNSSGDLNDYTVNSTGGVRPSVSLAPGTMVSDGNGTANFPFEVFLPEEQN